MKIGTTSPGSPGRLHHENRLLNSRNRQLEAKLEKLQEDFASATQRLTALEKQNIKLREVLAKSKQG